MKKTYMRIHPPSAIYHLPFAMVFTLCFLSSRAAHAGSITAGPIIVGSPVTITSETNPLKSGVTIQVTVDTTGADLVAFFEVSPVDTSLTLVASLSQNVTANVPANIFWPALWLIGTDAGRRNGTFIYQVTPPAGGTTGTPLPAPSDPAAKFTIDSVDIHSLKVAPSLDANQQPTFPFVITYALAKAAKVTAKIFDSTGALVRTIISNVTQADETVSSPSISWDGRDSNGKPAPIGVYTATITATDLFNPTEQATPRSKSFTVISQAGAGADPQKVFESSVFVYPNPVRGQGTFQMQAVRDGATLHLKIYTITGTLVRDETFPGIPAGSITTFNWDGTNQSGNKVGRGLYYYAVREEDAAGTLQTVKKMAVLP